MSDKKQKPKKPAGEKKARPPRQPMRTYQESPAGSFADKLVAHAKAIDRIAVKTTSWQNGAHIPYLLQARSALDTVVTSLNTLAAANFKPERKKGGGGLNVAVGMRVYLRAEAIAMLSKHMPDVASLECYVSIGADLSLKVMPIRAGGQNLTDRWVGMISKKLLSAVPLT